ncbi:Uma2 family endonuclease [Planktothrix sp. FACHB-1365]|uniref:Uma2 family endonuclease n=1 Tax=Planktothrix sp. FACHB-1365 TaxID=2692855 RepID=UPI001689EEA5|nr:Uma2 family endonuclease [Planktothrix sp. FACHB-1365]MBD2481981.1 Uma2 family endonuclease [Planktothrix sp. FACHB-1365]
MSIVEEQIQTPTLLNEVQFPPSDLLSQEPPLESELHLRQILLLLNSLEWLWQDRDDFYAIGNLTIYYSQRQKKSEEFRGPDFFVVLGTERKPRNSWVVWEEDGKYPNVIIEMLSKTTADTDRGEKKEIYQDVFRTPDYFWFDPKTLEFAGFHIVEGQYQPISPNENGWLWSQQLDLFLGILDHKLRFFTAGGELVLTTEEVAFKERQQRETLQQRADKLAAKLRELGIDPEQL